MHLDKKTKFLWVIGVPRSGTSLLVEYLGKYVDHYYNEPFEKYPLEKVQEWTFPECKSLALKYCVSWQHANFLSKKFKTSYFIHILRDPQQVVYSMTFPKKDAWPFRQLYDDPDDHTRFHKAVNRWAENMIGCMECCKKHRSIQISYENFEQEIPRLAGFLNLPLRKEDLVFTNRNDVNVSPENLRRLDLWWRVRPLKMELRKQVEDMLQK